MKHKGLTGSMSSYVVVILVIIAVALFILDQTAPKEKYGGKIKGQPLNFDISEKEMGDNEKDSIEPEALPEEPKIVNETPDEEVITEEDKFPEPKPNETIEEEIAFDNETGDNEEKDTKVTYFFFHASYCATCQTMLPWIREVGREHPTLNLELINLHSGNPYIKEFGVTMTTVSVILREENGERVSGTKLSGFMDKRRIEQFICTELDDEICNNL